MMQALIVFIGGGAGAVARFGLSKWIAQLTTSAFPWPILTVNLLGAFLIGMMAGWGELRPTSPSLQLLLVTGVLGGFTTFSAFSLESALMLQRGDYLFLALYIAASVLGTIALVFAGSVLMRGFG